LEFPSQPLGAGKKKAGCLDAGVAYAFSRLNGGIRTKMQQKNLIGLAITQLQTTASSAGSNACGEVGSGKVRKNRVKPTSMKQENNTKLSFS